MTEEIILRTSHLGKRYGKRWAVRDLDLSVHRGEVFGFLGPNGAGKSTTIRMLLSLVRPTTGEVELFGVPLRSRRAEVLARVGGLVERADFYLYLTARRNLQFIADLRGGLPARAIDEVLDTVGLSARAGDRVKSYSHGMKQRLGLAAALLGWPEFVILDEPTTGLDPQGIKEVRDLIIRLAAEQRMTIFLSSHLLAEIEQLATTMAIINGGSLVVQGKVRDLLADGTGVVRITATPIERALAILRTLPYVVKPEAGGGEIRASLPAGKVPALNAALVQAGVEVHALVPQRSLEEYFLTITEGASEIR